MKELAIIILAAGQGKRMKNPELPKVLVELSGKPLIGHVIEQALKLKPKKIVNIIGHFREKVIDYVDGLDINDNSYAVQEEQLGTGHAVNMAKPNLLDFNGDILILCGDVPLLQSNTLYSFIKEHNKSGSLLSVLTADTSNPFGYGRIIRGEDGSLEKIVEQKDATEEEAKTKEINSGVYVVSSNYLFNSLAKVKSNNAQNEYYLTDIVKIINEEGHKVNAIKGVGFDELMGVNSPEDLEKAETYYKENLAK